MLRTQKVFALIPARGGSKGVPRKNLAIVGGKTLVEYAIEAALGCARIDHCFVSSDSDEIVALADSRGARTIRRPAWLATDEAPAAGVVSHFLDVVNEEFEVGNPVVVYLQPTSPLRTSAHIDAAFDVLEESGASTLVSVVELQRSPFKSFKIGESGRLEALFDERLSNVRRQELPRTYVPNGAIYVFSRDDFLAREGFPSNGSIPLVMSDEDSIDVDVPSDLERVQRILGERHG